MCPGPIRLALALALLLGACKVTVPPFDDPDTRFACHGDEDCADDYYCFHEGGADLGYCTSGNTTNDACLDYPCANGLVCSVNQSGQASCQECRYVPNSCGSTSICAKSNSSVSSMCAPNCQTVGSTCDGFGAPGQCIVSQGFPNGNNVQQTVQVCASCGTMCAASECTYASANVEAWEQGAVCDSPPVTCTPHASCGSGYCIGGSCSNNPGQTCSTGCSINDICGDDGFCHPSNCTSSTCPTPFMCNTYGQCELASTCPAVPCVGDDVCVAGTCEPPPWYQLAGSVSNGLPNTNNLSDFDMAMTTAGNPIVAWSTYDGGNSIYVLRVQRWNGTAWQQLAGTGYDGALNTTAQGSARYPSIAVDSAGNPIVAWEQTVAGMDTGIYVMRYTGSAWLPYTQAAYPLSSTTGVGIAISNMAPTLAYSPSVAVDSSDRVLVVWRERDNIGNYQVYLRRWNGTAWGDINGSASTVGVSSDASGDATLRPPDVAISGYYLAVAWYEGDTVRVSTSYNDGTWAYDNITFAGYTIDGIDLANNQSDLPTAAISYTTGLSDHGVEVWRADTGNWISLGLQVWSAVTPSLARDSASNLSLAWATTSSDVYLGYYRTSAMGWEQVDGSQSNEGISFPPLGIPSYPVQNPVVAAGPRLCVAWIENAMIRLRCHNQPP